MTRLTEFRPVPGLEGVYEVNGLGLVWSVPRRVERPRSGDMRVGGRFMRPARDRKGYCYVNLKRGGRETRWYIHQLVARVFIGPRPEGLMTCHNNGDSQDNRASNLRYDTAKGNMADRMRHTGHHFADSARCIMGHEYTAENTAIRPGRNSRVCITCRSQKPRRISAERAHRRSRNKAYEASLKIADTLEVR